MASNKLVAFARWGNGVKRFIGGLPILAVAEVVKTFDPRPVPTETLGEFRREMLHSVANWGIIGMELWSLLEDSGSLNG